MLTSIATRQLRNIMHDAVSDPHRGVNVHLMPDRAALRRLCQVATWAARMLCPAA